MTPGKYMTRMIKQYLRRPAQFADQFGSVKLRPYQVEAVNAVVSSIFHRRGMEFVWIFPRQSGKDENLAVLISYLLTYYSDKSGEIVFINPTFTPQAETSMRRLEARLRSNILTRGKWQRKGGYIYQMNRAFCTYMSADPAAHVVGATANLLLAVNETQDIGLLKFDKEISPMVASTNATTLFSGTRWTSDTLLERELQRCRADEAKDGRKRVFFFTAEDVRQYVPAYGSFLDGVIARLGRQHPLVKTQYFCETIDAQIGMFPPGRLMLAQGSHSARTAPEPGKTYAFLIDVAGQDESTFSLPISGSETGYALSGAAHPLCGAVAGPVLSAVEGPHNSSPDSTALSGAARSLSGSVAGPHNSSRDSTALKIVEIDRSPLALQGKPGYLTVLRMEWTGEKLVQVFGALRALVQAWNPLRVVIDATGVGEGLWSLLDNAFGAKTVIPVKFTAKLKSELGYGFIAMLESGRYREYTPFPDSLRRQMEHCRSEIVPGPAQLMRWGVPDGARDPVSGELLHDDDLMTSALCVMLDGLEWYTHLPTVWTTPRDPLEEMDGRF